MKTILGRGVLTWFRFERVGDRYGSVWLAKDDDSDDHVEMEIPKGKGTLVAVIVEARKSHHIGDICRGIGPKMPTNGQRFELGTGKAFAEKSSGIKAIGVEPDGDRENDWLDPRLLYQCHNSLVELSWETEGQP